MAPDGAQDQRDLRRAAQQAAEGKTEHVLEQIEHGHHVFRAYWKHAFVKQYEKFSTFLRNEICSNNLSDFGLKKGLDHLRRRAEKIPGDHRPLRQLPGAVPERSRGLSLCCSGWRLPITVGTAKFPGIKIHDTRIIA